MGPRISLALIICLYSGDFIVDFTGKKKFQYFFRIKNEFFCDADVTVIWLFATVNVLKLYTKFLQNQFFPENNMFRFKMRSFLYVSFSHATSYLLNKSFGTMSCLFRTKVEQVQLNRMYQS